MIKWKGRVIKDFVTLLNTMSELRTEKEGLELRDAVVGEFGFDDAKIYLGFMIAYFKPAARRAELSRFLGGVKNPLIPDCDEKDPEPELAMRIGLAQCRAWMRTLEFSRNTDLEAVKFSTEDRTPGDAFEERKKSAEWNF
jgi:hypothetical protein